MWGHMAAIGKWIIQIVLGWVFDVVKDLIEKSLERLRKKKEREEDNAAAEVKLEQSESEKEVIDAGADLLKR